MNLGESLLRYKKDQIYIGADLETCNLNLMTTNYPWQCSWILFTQKEILETHNYYINWGDKFKISKGAAIITHFDEDLVKKEGKDPHEIYLLFRKYLYNKDIIPVFHNGLCFDTLIENFWCNEVGENHNWDYLNRLYDTMQIAKAIKKSIKPDLNNFLAFQYKMANFIEKGLKSNLSLLVKEYGINNETDNYHDALFDIKMMREIFLKQIWMIEV